jgi:hypothetical protein
MRQSKIANGANCFKKPSKDKKFALKNTQKHNLTIFHLIPYKFILFKAYAT